MGRLVPGNVKGMGGTLLRTGQQGENILTQAFIFGAGNGSPSTEINPNNINATATTTTYTGVSILANALPLLPGILMCTPPSKL
jgi:hypothetical protein